MLPNLKKIFFLFTFYKEIKIIFSLILKIFFVFIFVKNSINSFEINENFVKNYYNL